MKDLQSLFALLLACLSFLFSSSLLSDEPQSHSVLVTVPPHKFFVEKIAGETVKVILFVPPGASAHTYEPTPKQMLTASKVDMWFRIGEAFEEKAAKTLASYNPHMKFVDLLKGLNLIPYDEHSHHHCCSVNHYDLHIWLSARMAKIQAQTMAKALIQAYPEHADLFQKNLSLFEKELDDLDQELSRELKSITQKTIMVSHPAYAYFCRDYGLTQLPIEFEGKDPTPKQLTNTINRAKEARIKKIFVQPQYPSKGAHLIAKQIGAEVITLDPYSEQYLKTMREIAHNFASE